MYRSIFKHCREDLYPSRLKRGSNIVQIIGTGEDELVSVILRRCRMCRLGMYVRHSRRVRVSECNQLMITAHPPLHTEEILSDSSLRFLPT